MRFPKGVFTRCRVMGKTANSVTARIPGGRLITARQGDDCTSSGIVTILSDGNRAIAISGNQGRPTLKQMEEFFHSRPVKTPPEPEVVTDEDELKLIVRAIFGIDRGAAGYDFYIGGDRAVPIPFLKYIPSLANISGTVAHAWINATGKNLTDYRAHAAIVAQSQGISGNAPCCVTANVASGWVANVTAELVETPATRHLVIAYQLGSFSDSKTTENYNVFEPNFTITDNYFNGWRASYTFRCDQSLADQISPFIVIGEIKGREEQGFRSYYLDSRVGSPVNQNDQTYNDPEFWLFNERAIDELGAPIPDFFLPGGEYHVTPYYLQIRHPAALSGVIAWMGNRDEITDYLLAQGEETATQSSGPIHRCPPNFTGPVDNCTIIGDSSVEFVTSNSKWQILCVIPESTLQRYPYCGAPINGQPTALNPCGGGVSPLPPTETYCVALPGFPDDPNIIPERKPVPPGGDGVFDGWVGVQGTDAHNIELDDPPSLPAPNAVTTVNFHYCNPDPYIYQLIYKWAGDEGAGQILEAGEGLPDDEVVADFRDQNWYDWRNEIGGQIQEGRVNSLPVFSEGGTPLPMVLPTVRVADAQWVASSPDRTRAIAKLGAEYRLYTGGASSVMTVPAEIATLFTNYPKSINWYSVDTLFVVASDASDFATVSKSVKVHRLKLTGSVLSQVGPAVDVPAQSLGNAGAVIFAVSAGE